MFVIRAALSGSVQHHERLTIDGTAEELDLVHRALEAGVDILDQRSAYSTHGIGSRQRALLQEAIDGSARPRPVDTSAIFADHGEDSPL